MQYEKERAEVCRSSLRTRRHIDGMMTGAHVAEAQKCIEVGIADVKTKPRRRDGQVSAMIAGRRARPHALQRDTQGAVGASRSDAQEDNA